MAEIPVVVGGPLPDADGGQVRGLERRHLPLVHPVVRDAVQADLAAAPGLRRRPLDAVVKVPRLPGRPDVEDTRRAGGAAGVDPDARIAVRHPLLGVHDLPVLVLVGRVGHHLGIGLDHQAPLVGVEVLEDEALAVRPVGQDGRDLAGPERAVHVGPQHDPVVHGDGHVPLDAHPVPDFAPVLAREWRPSVNPRSREGPWRRADRPLAGAGLFVTASRPPRRPARTRARRAARRWTGPPGCRRSRASCPWRSGRGRPPRAWPAPSARRSRGCT